MQHPDWAYLFQGQNKHPPKLGMGTVRLSKRCRVPKELLQIADKVGNFGWALLKLFGTAQSSRYRPVSLSTSRKPNSPVVEPSQLFVPVN